MECVEPVVGIANCLGTPVCKYLQYHRKLNDYVRNFKRIRDELNCKMEDIELQLEAELLRPLGTIPKKEVENWLKAVKKMIREAQVVENKVSNGRYLCHACNGKLVDEKTQEMKEFLDKAPNASEGLAIDRPSAGLPLPTSELVGKEAVRNEIWACLMQEETIKDELNCKVEEIELQLKAELLRPLGKIPKKGVENWLKAVKQMIREAHVVENKVSNGRYLCRACNGKLVDEKTREMKEFLDKAPNASEGLAMDGPSAGLPLPTSELVGEEAVRNEIWACLMQEEEFNVMKVQDNIASALESKEYLDKEEDKLVRAAILSEMLKNAGKHVLILDDVWDEVSLEEVGIPEPSGSNGCKLVLTTRSEHVCKYMGCKRSFSIASISHWKRSREGSRF
ncbi:hypothetical protein GOBAR_DD32229 [Gossypium barbadense]|nr:hypothetical protein GOBAR_DD32229 [Gossypium barbadense]